jgi:hypothetical protein
MCQRALEQMQLAKFGYFEVDDTATTPLFPAELLSDTEIASVPTEPPTTSKEPELAADNAGMYPTFNSANACAIPRPACGPQLGLPYAVAIPISTSPFSPVPSLDICKGSEIQTPILPTGARMTGFADLGSQDPTFPFTIMDDLHDLTQEQEQAPEEQLPTRVSSCLFEPDMESASEAISIHLLPYPFCPTG